MSAGRRKGPSRPVIDLVDFARTAGVLEGEGGPAQFPRLREALHDDSGRIAWRVEGSRRARAEGGAESYLALRLAGSVVMECNRCLKGVPAELDEERLFKVLPTESQAERFDAESDECDALVASAEFDVLELVEDEAILALPIAPRHARCELPLGAAQPEPAGEQAVEQRPNPFAVLASLKGSRKDGQGG